MINDIIDDAFIIFADTVLAIAQHGQELYGLQFKITIQITVSKRVRELRATEFAIAIFVEQVKQITLFNVVASVNTEDGLGLIRLTALISFINKSALKAHLNQTLLESSSKDRSVYFSCRALLSKVKILRSNVSRLDSAIFIIVEEEPEMGERCFQVLIFNWRLNINLPHLFRAGVVACGVSVFSQERKNIVVSKSGLVDIYFFFFFFLFLRFIRNDFDNFRDDGLQ